MKKKYLLVILIIIVAGVAAYFINQKNIANREARLVEINELLEKKSEELSAIELYLDTRKKGITDEKELSYLQEKIILIGEGLITAAKENLTAFDRETKALRTIIQMEIDELDEEMQKIR